MLTSEHRPPSTAGGCVSLVGVLVDTVVRYKVGEGSSVLVEVDEDTYGVEAVSRTSEGVLEAGQRLESALGSVRDAAQAALDAMSMLSPETVEVEFGIKLAGEAGALIAKASAEGHFTVRLSWSPGTKSLSEDKKP
jgi:Trypsin-co-occurring domain 1